MRTELLGNVGSMRWSVICLLTSLVVTAMLSMSVDPLLADDGDAAVERTRKQVRMLDDIYKGSIVTITQNYVNDKETIPAGTAFKQLFAAIEQKGWHKVRLLDATGEPYNDENAPAEGFEAQAVKQLLAGKDWYEDEVVEDGKRFLRVATPIPVVFEKCIMCHDNYADVDKGQPIGALSYMVPIE